jgi:hypothetical protein
MGDSGAEPSPSPLFGSRVGGAPGRRGSGLERSTDVRRTAAAAGSVSSSAGGAVAGVNRGAPTSGANVDLLPAVARASGPTGTASGAASRRTVTGARSGNPGRGGTGRASGSEDGRTGLLAAAGPSVEDPAASDSGSSGDTDCGVPGGDERCIGCACDGGTALRAPGRPLGSRGICAVTGSLGSGTPSPTRRERGGSGLAGPGWDAGDGSGWSARPAVLVLRTGVGSAGVPTAAPPAEGPPEAVESDDGESGIAESLLGPASEYGLSSCGTGVASVGRGTADVGTGSGPSTLARASPVVARARSTRNGSPAGRGGVGPGRGPDTGDGCARRTRIRDVAAPIAPADVAAAGTFGSNGADSDAAVGSGASAGSSGHCRAGGAPRRRTHRRNTGREAVTVRWMCATAGRATPPAIPRGASRRISWPSGSSEVCGCRPAAISVAKVDAPEASAMRRCRLSRSGSTVAQSRCCGAAALAGGLLPRSGVPRLNRWMSRRHMRHPSPSASRRLMSAISVTNCCRNGCSRSRISSNDQCRW